MLVVVALAAAAVAAQMPVDIVFLVSAAFSLAASTVFAPLVLGVFWKRANRAGAVCGMLTGLVVTSYYMVQNEPWLRGVFRIGSPPDLWWGIQPVAAGAFGMPAAVAAMVIASLATRRPGAATREFVDRLRLPNAP
jgi:cation/acetate symporter